MATEIAQYKLFINGEWRDASSGKTFRSADPFTGEDWAELPEGDVADVEAAIDAARAAFEDGWWRRGAEEKGASVTTASRFAASQR